MISRWTAIRSLFLATFGLGVSCFLGCQAGYPPATIEAAPWNDDVAARKAARIAEGKETEATRELEARLFMTEQGRVIARAIRAQGGWDTWLAFSGVSYVRTRVSDPKPGDAGEPEAASNRFQFSGSSLGSFLCPCEPSAHEAHFSKRQGIKGDLPQASPITRDVDIPRVAEEFFVFCLPFVLQGPGILREYLGVEEDLRTGMLFEKVRCVWPSKTREVRLIAWFERATFVLRRALFITESGQTVLVRFSQWTEFGGIKVPTRRDIHHVKRVYARWDPEKPVAVDILSDLRLPD